MTRSTRQTTLCVAKHEQGLHVQGSRVSTLAQSGGFTLVELLVVITIIGVLAALIVPAVFQARVSAKNAAIKAEIDMLHMAIMNYKNEYGSFPPCSSVASATSPAAKHVNRLFPRSSGAGNTSVRSPENALVRWLRGYSSDPVDPFGGARKKIFDFDESRVTSADEYHPTDKPSSPYIYINSDAYFLARTPTSYTLRPYVQLRITEDANGNGVLDTTAPTEDVNGNTELDCEAFNSDTFQILCAGQDETWGTEDDLSNFWKGTRGDQ